MTVSSDLNRISYTGNGTTTVFPVNYYFLENSHLLVVLRSAAGVETVQTLTTNYTVTGAGNEAGGSVTMLVAPPVGTTLVIQRDVPATQETDYLANDPFPAESHERALDKLTMLVQQNESDNDRSIKIPITETSNTQVPNSVNRANRLLGFASNGGVSVSGSTIAQVDAAVATINTIASAPSGNSAGISHIAAGLGATPTTVQTKLRETVSVKDFGAVGDGVTDDTAAIQACMDASLDVYFPSGNYKISAALQLRPFQNIVGSGRGDYLGATPSTANIQGTRIFQTAAVSLFEIGNPPVLDSRQIVIEDMTLQGNYGAPTAVATYGIYQVGSQALILNRISAFFFKNAGFYIGSSVTNAIYDCRAIYCEDVGMDLAYTGYFTGGLFNTYMTNVIGGSYTQNKNAGVRLGVSSFQVNFFGVDCESNGNFYPTGTGYGFQMTSEARNVNIKECWFEGNKIHVVVGSISSPQTVPRNIVIDGCQLWSVIGGSTTLIQINAGTPTTIANNNFYGAGNVVLDKFASGPIFTNNTYGNSELDEFNVVNQNGEKVSVNVKPETQAFPFPELTSWSASNCTVTKEYITSPAGNVPVYKITPLTIAPVQMQSTNSPWGFKQYFNTFGCFTRKDGSAFLKISMVVASVNMPKSYGTTAVNQYPLTNEWTWISLGRSLDSADTGNQAVNLVWLVTTLDPIYVTGFSMVRGISHVPFIQNSIEIATATSASQPTVYGKTAITSSGAGTITNFLGGALGQVVTFIAEHICTITDGTNIFLNGSANFVMNPTDTLTIIQKADGNWYEISRSDNT